jgi:diacylglycerol O-acyltransferase
MAQQHLDRLSAVDAGFLHQEGASTHMHIGAVALFESPPPAFDDLVEHIRGRLHLVPRYRQKLAAPPLGLGRQRWVDDPTFNLEYHVRHTALPTPGGEDELRRLVSRLFAQQLDRTKPLWELWVVEGVTGERFALVSKTHHALVDGVAGVDLMTMLFDLAPEPRDEERAPAWVPRPEPTAAELTASALRAAARTALSLPLRAAAAASAPQDAVAVAREAAGGLGEVLWAGLNPPPDTPLNVPIGPHRRIAFVDASLADFKRVKDAFGGTVNDVVLAVTAGALRSWLHARGESTDGLELKACVPVSTRATVQRGELGNRLTQVVAALPVYLADPLSRLHEVSRAMRDVKESRQALGAEVIASAQDFAPPTILAQASRLNFSSRFYNLLVTNIPGPQFPLYLLGRRMTLIFPIAFLAGDRALAVAVMSYNGRAGFGLIADLDAMPDLDVVADGLRDTIAEYVALAERAGSARGRAGAVRTMRR